MVMLMDYFMFDFLTNFFSSKSAQVFPSGNVIDNMSFIRWPAFFSLYEIDLFLYLTFMVLLVQFSYMYSSCSANFLFEYTRHYSRFYGIIAFIFLSFKNIYFFIYSYSLSVVGDYSNSFVESLIDNNDFIQFSKWVIVLIWLFLSHFISYLSRVFTGHNIMEVPLLSHLILCFSLTIISASNFALLLICLEGFSLTLYIMATVGREYGGVTAATKYFAFGTLGSILFSWGVVHLYAMTSTLSFTKIFFILEFYNNELYWMKALWWSLSLILGGLLVKLGAAPLHSWVPDVYAGVPTFITAFYSIFVKLVVFLLFIRFYNFSVGNSVEFVAFFSLVVGTIGALRQVEIKRFIAYGSITHVGFLLLGDLVASWVYLFSYLIASLVFFSVLLSVRVLFYRELTYLLELRNLLVLTSQWSRIFFVCALASFAGLPPFAGFYGKMMIWSSLVEDIYLFNDVDSYFLLVANLVASLVIIFYYMRLVLVVYLGGDLQLVSVYTTSNNMVLYNKVGSSDVNNSIARISVFLKLRSFIVECYSLQFLCIIFLTFWTFCMPFVLSAMTSIT